jgi:hypothetical protein
MFAPRYFAPKHFAPRYFPPIALAVIITEPDIVYGGGGYYRGPLHPEDELDKVRMDDEEILELLFLMFQLGVFDG